MAKFYSKENLRFLLNEVLHVEDLCKQDYFKEHSAENFDMIIEAADSLATNHMQPILVEMDRNPPRMENGRIKVHPNMRGLMKKFGEDGWINMSAPHEFGGQQVPFTVLQATGFIMAAANYGIMAYPFLTNGAAHLIETFGVKELHDAYLAKMYGGEWQGTMALTEPQAGSSLTDVTTSAKPTDKGYYLIKGQKIFISCGDHDGVDNIVHLMLARIEGAPAGTKGISLFIVPRMRPENGGLVFNDVNTAGLFHKMGYHGAPIAHLIMGESDDCRGYLVGEANKGLSYMFQMMNEARIGVGLQATAISSAAYYNSLDYANVRLQGRKITEKDPAKPQIPIIQHADVKRMLLFQKSIVEGSLALCMQACMYLDKWRTAEEGEEKESNFLKLELLTPVAKSYPAEMSILSTSTGLQIFGGYGFTKEYMAELFFRETRIHTLHEGTTAIHGMDLMGRKLSMAGGKAVLLLFQEIMSDIEKAQKYDSLVKPVAVLSQRLVKLQELSMHMMGVAQNEGAEVFLADATVFLELFGILTIGWQWLKMATVAEDTKAAGGKGYSPEFLQSKLHAMEYYFEYEIPKTEGLFVRMISSSRVTVNAKPEEIV